MRAGLDGTGVESVPGTPFFGYRNLAFDQIPVPEPASAAVFALGALGLMRRRW